ncbi:hypothetical protein NDU88_006654 [Pleurodeles waltl]|uniref:Uncharacterized protein n=1 Tax=Pleurodeles waltl TaxID=8319 RepID=A0AAV7WB68_PLEWA|nr:hypothetical protein NDU88_006654 [Pleurodeles waltl]
MVTAERRGDRVTRNVSWFRKATFMEPSVELDSDDHYPDRSITGGQTQEEETTRPAAPVPAGDDTQMAQDERKRQGKQEKACCAKRLLDRQSVEAWVEILDAIRAGGLGCDQGAGPMVTAERRGDRVTQNVSWFRKATFMEPSVELDSDDHYPDRSITGGQTQEEETTRPAAPVPAGDDAQMAQGTNK